jgi:hypothetical protein
LTQAQAYLGFQPKCRTSLGADWSEWPANLRELFRAREIGERLAKTFHEICFSLEPASPAS